MVKGQLESGLIASIKIREHELISGLPEKLGGHDEGPDPHEMIEAGLAACTILTCQLYAHRKGWNLISTNVSVKIESETKEASRIRREISFEGELSDEQKIRLLEIANKCPIHNLLESKISIETELVYS